MLGTLLPVTECGVELLLLMIAWNEWHKPRACVSPDNGFVIIASICICSRNNFCTHALLRKLVCAAAPSIELSVLPVSLVGGVCAGILTQCLRELPLYLCNWHIPKVMITYISFVVVLKTCQAERCLVSQHAALSQPLHRELTGGHVGSPNTVGWTAIRNQVDTLCCKCGG